MNKISDILRSHKNWCKDAFAKTGNNHICSLAEDKAAKFCLLGAINKVGKNYEEREKFQNIILKAIQHLYPRQRYSNIAVFNDKASRSFKDIQRVLKYAKV